jgi:hypothetical protein
MSEISKRIDEIVKVDLAVRLKVEGFRKSSRTFFRPAAEHTAVVNIQASLHNEGDSGTFAVNLGVYFPVFAELGGGLVSRGAFPKEYECSIRDRLGALAHEGRDYWWPVQPGADTEALGRSVGAAWAAYGRSWMERVSTLQGAFESTREQNLYFPAAIFALALGDRESAASLIRRAIERLPRGRPRFESWGARHGLLTHGTENT